MSVSVSYGGDWCVRFFFRVGFSMEGIEYYRVFYKYILKEIDDIEDVD